MRFLIDENVPLKLAERIIELYPGSIYVLRSELSGRPDEEVFSFSIVNSIPIITFDRDFLDIVHYPLEPSPGRIVLRYKSLKIEKAMTRTATYLSQLERRGLEITNKLVVFTNEKVRIRSKP